MSKKYVEKRDEGYWIKGKRISLDSVVCAFQNGQSPESIQRSFTLLTLEEIYGAIAFYLANQSETDDYLKNEEMKFDKMRKESRQKNSDGVRRWKSTKESLAK